MSEVHARSAVINEKNTILGNDTLVPISFFRWTIGIIITLAIVVAPWITLLYIRASKVDNLEERITLLENISVQTKTRLDNIEPLVKETRDTVVKILTAQPYSSNR